jgi:hypothetical protein
MKHSINMTLNTSLPNGQFYHLSLSKNEEIKHQIQELLKNGHIQPRSSPCGSLIMLVHEGDGRYIAAFHQLFCGGVFR